MINETIQQTIIETQSQALIPSLIILYLGMVFIAMPLTGWALKSNKGWGKFPQIWLWTTILGGLILSGIILTPSLMADIGNWSKELIKSILENLNG